MQKRTRITATCAALLCFIFALGSVAGPGGYSPDADLDGINDNDDNCLGVVNSSQRDDDEDGYGNLCDADHDQNCVVGGSDVSLTFAALGTGAPWAPKNSGAFDVDENGTVGGSDVSSTFGDLGGAPGPSARACADCTAAPGSGVCP